MPQKAFSLPCLPVEARPSLLFSCSRGKPLWSHSSSHRDAASLILVCTQTHTTPLAIRSRPRALFCGALPNPAPPRAAGVRAGPHLQERGHLDPPQSGVHFARALPGERR
eukprot:6199276-Pleurochrysis_carterae.AAC.1